MIPERHARVKELFLAACRRPAAERTRFLQEACGEDAELRARVEDLLAQHSERQTPDAGAGTQTAASAREIPAGPEPRGGQADSASRLETGVVVAGRYRIVALLGEGGMGEVYRAEDLQLRQTVALKFLPAQFAHDAAWLRRFRQEVRLAREVTHPNVCRVYDLADADGEYFISMEYVDGENLKALLSRIGRLPRDKALQIARQLCAGLAAAHAKDVLHRDLKPANIMLDGRGQVRITDFGLAATHEEIRGLEVLAGTPAYMAPEQLSGKEVSVRSDIYALGLVLYELFTGKSAFQADSFAEYARIKEGSRPTPPSRVIEDIDPAVERVILACLEPKPEDRPAGVLAVAAALPGSDLLAAALAAGETPSPEMVAAAGTGRALGARWASVGLAAFVCLLAAVIFLTSLTHPLLQPPAAKSPQVLAEQARAILREVQSGTPRDEASGFLDYVRWAATAYAAPAWASVALRYAVPGDNHLVFWYRASATPLGPVDAANVLFGGARVTPADPPPTDPGMASVVLDPAGRLLGLEVASEPFLPATQPATAADWSDLLACAGLSPAALVPCAPQAVLHVPGDLRHAWRGPHPDDPNTMIRVEAAERAGDPVFLAVLDDLRAGSAADTEGPSLRDMVLDDGWKVLLAITILVALPLARLNLQRGRSDLRGAMRLAGFVYALSIGSWLLQAQHASDLDDELSLFVFSLIGGLVESLLVWLFYIALEPYARRYWPHTLVAWSRLLRGQVHDPLVGGEILLGAVLGTGWAVIQALERPLTIWLGLPARGVVRADGFFAGLLSTRYALAGDLDILQSAIYQGLYFLLLLVLLRMLLRRPVVAGVVGAVLLAVLLAPRGSNPLVSWPLIGGAGAGLLVWFMLRFGLLTIVTGLLVVLILVRAPLTLHLGVWYSDLSVVAIALTVGVAVYGFLAARGSVEQSRRMAA